MNTGRVVFLLMCLCLKDTNAGYSTRFNRPPKTRLPEGPVVYPQHPPPKRSWEDTPHGGPLGSVKPAEESAVQKEVPQISHGISGEHSEEPIGESVGVKPGSHPLTDLQISKEVPHHIKEGHSKENTDESVGVKTETHPSSVDGEISHEGGHFKEAIDESIGIKPETHPSSVDVEISHEIKHELVGESGVIQPESHSSSNDEDVSHEKKKTIDESVGIKTESHSSSDDGEISHESKDGHSKTVIDESVGIKTESHPSVIDVAEKPSKHEESHEFSDIEIKPETQQDTHSDEVKIREENPKDVIKPGQHSGISSTVLVKNDNGEVGTKNEEKHDIAIPVGNDEDIKVDDYPDEQKKAVDEDFPKLDGKLIEPYPIKVTNTNEKSVYDLMESLRLTRFLHLADEVGLKELFTAEGPITIFAPSDFALSKLKADEIRSLATNRDLLKEFMLYHCVDGSIYGAPLEEEDSFILNTKVGKSIHLNKYGKEWYVNGIPVTTKNQIGNNGAIHVINHPLFPFPIGDILHTLETSGNFNIFCELIRNAKLDEQYFKNDDATYTIFAPTDVAFSKLPEANVEWLKWDIPAIKNMFRQLTVKGVYYISCIPNLKENKLSPLAEDTTLFLTGYPDAVSVNDVRLNEKDITASNGCIHTIDDIWFLSQVPPSSDNSKKH